MRMNGDHEQLLAIVRSVRNRWRLKVLLKGLAVLVVSAMALLLVSGWAIDASRFDAATVTAVRIVVYLAFLALFVRSVIWPLVRRVSDERVALYLEENEPSLGGQVLAAVELGREPPASSGGGASTAMVEHLVRSAVEGCREVDDGRRVERKALWRSSGLVAGSTAASFVFFLVGPAFLHTTAPVLLDPWKKADVANPYSIRVEPGDATVAVGSDLEVTATLEGFAAAGVELVMRSGEGEWTRWTMLHQDASAEPALEGETAEPVYNLLIFDVHEPTEYFVESSGVASSVFRVAVKELPYVEDVHLTYHFPPYTGLDPVEQPGSGDVAALVGTEVRLEVTPTFPVPGGAIAIDGAEELPLTLAGEGRLTGSFTVGEPGVYRILLDSAEDGRVVASPDYVIDPVADQPPTLVLAKPGRDLQVTNLEEVVTEVRAQDDFGVSLVELVYSVNGGDEKTATLYTGRPGRKDFAGTHTLYMEEHELVPGDLVSYYARALDAYGDPQTDETTSRDPTHETISDIYFLEIRPFDRNYRQADQGGQPGQMGSELELSDQQRMVISATFKLARDRSRSAEDAAAEVATVAMSQGRLREQALKLLESMLQQGMFGDGSPMSSMVELLPLAADEMSLAEEALGEHELKKAMAPEQRALQYLQRMEAQFREVQVARGEQGGGGGQGEISDELADLFEMERDQLRNQYEQVQRSRQQEVDDALDELLEKLRELARRQQQENERMRARARQAADNQTRAGSSGKSQRQLAEEAEEVARKLERLAREESLPDLAETARKLREAAEQMRRAAAAGERTDEALGSSALDQLREARRQLDRDKSGRLGRDTQRALERTRRLREQQERIVDQVDRLDPSDARYGETLQSLMEAKARMGGEVGGLESELDQLASDFQREQPEPSRRLKAAAEDIRDLQIREKILYSRGVVQERSREYARNFEEHIEDALGRLEERLRDAAGAIGETREQRLGRALEETRDVVSALESLEERLETADPQAWGGPEGGVGPREGSGSVGPRDLRQLGRELEERRLQLEALEGRLRSDGVDPADLERIIDRLRGLELGDPAAVRETLAALENEVVQGLKEFEFGLRRSLGKKEDESLAQVTNDDVPDGYEEMVEKYYKALAGGER